MKILGTFVILLLSVFLTTIDTMGSGSYGMNQNQIKHMSSSNMLLEKKKKKKNKKVKLLPGKLYFQGWVRFFKYTGGKQLRPTTFFKNPQYLLQRVTKQELKKKDKIGFINIIDRFTFYCQLSKDTLSVLSTRNPLPNGDLSHVVDNLQIQFIKHIPKENRNRSSVNDIGNFKEGKCLQVYTRRPTQPNLKWTKTSKSVNENWIFCFSDMKDKTKLITYLILLKENQQHETVKHAATKKPSTAKLLKHKTKSIEKRKDAKPKDGYWILLQDWTGCSLKCGGGKSYQQWMCVPPKKGGRKCKGDSLRTKPCNTKPCPVTKVSNTAGVKHEKGANAIQPGIVRSQPFSMRPQNYMKCMVKENDVLFINPKVDKKLKTPSRIVMNTRTISLYTDEHFKDAVFSFNLKETIYTPYKKDKCCFNLQSGTQIYTICGGFGQRCGGGKEKYSFFESWRKHFNQFKYTCYEEFKHESWVNAQAKKAAQEVRSAAGISNMEDRANLIKKKLVKKEVDVMAGKVSKTEVLAMKAIKREFDIEKMITSEIQHKAMLETKVLLEKKKHELKKKAALEKAFTAVKTESDRKQQKNNGHAQIKNIKKDAAKQIVKKRLKMRNKIKEILKKSHRRKKQIESEIRQIRSVVAKKLLAANKKGSASVCRKGLDERKHRLNYCKENVVDSYVDFKECMNQDTFGNVCCENEFGNMYIEERDKCIALCDRKLQEAVEDGEWV